MKTLISAFLLTALSVPAPALPSLGDLQGKVQYRTPAAQQWAQARKGQGLAEGVRLRTGWLSWAEIRYDDGSLVTLGPDTEFVVYTAKPEEYFSRLFEGFIRAVVRPTKRKFSVKTPAAIAAVRGTRFTVTASKSGTTRVAVFSGVVAVTDLKGKEELVKPEQTLAANEEGAGKPERTPPAMLDSGWAMSPPRGFSKSPKGSNWQLSGEDAAGFSVKGVEVLLERRETLSAGRRFLKWKEGAEWPADCPPGTQPRETRVQTLDDSPLFSYACPAKDLTKGVWQTRYFEIPVLDKNGRAEFAVSLRYGHYVQPKLPPLADLRRIYGGRGASRDYLTRYRDDVMPRVAEATPATRIDGPGYSYVLESVLTLYQEKWGKNTEGYTGKVVPVIE